MNIFLTTNFDNASISASKKAVALMRDVDKDIQFFLLHAFKQMAPYSNQSTIPVISNAEWEKECKKKLTDQAAALSEITGNRVKDIFIPGSILEAVDSISADDKPDLIIMPMREKSGFQQMTFGSNTLQVVSNADFPVLVLPEKWEFEKPNKMILTSDLKAPEMNYEGLKLFKDFIHNLDMDLEVIHIDSDSKDEGASKEDLANTALHRYLEEIEHSHKVLSSDKIVDGISEYIEDKDQSIVSTISRDKNFFEKLFGISQSRKLVTESEKPVLILK